METELKNIQILIELILKVSEAESSNIYLKLKKKYFNFC